MTAEDLPKFELGTNHVVVPLAFFNQVMEVYHHHVAGRLVKEEPPPPQSPASQRIPLDMNLNDVEFQSRGIPAGYTPRGAAAKKVESED